MRVFIVLRCLGMKRLRLFFAVDNQVWKCPCCWQVVIYIVLLQKSKVIKTNLRVRRKGSNVFRLDRVQQSTSRGVDLFGGLALTCRDQSVVVGGSRQHCGTESLTSFGIVQQPSQAWVREVFDLTNDVRIEIRNQDAVCADNERRTLSFQLDFDFLTNKTVVLAF